ncbi:MAG: hypothetical protein M3O09_04300 [Acidobacteriota bacterium]|nr:hypothetical protein [Acidobacteriota bacterium]
MLDTHYHLKQILPVELHLAEDVIQKVNRSGDLFSVITFGFQDPILIKSAVSADEAAEAVRSVNIEQRTGGSFSVRFYDSLDLALRKVDNSRPTSLLVISEGGEDLSRKTFKEAVVRTAQLHLACDVAIVADHPLYGLRGVQRYGFSLRKLATKTHGQYVEVIGGEKTLPRSVDTLSRGILNR